MFKDLLCKDRVFSIQYGWGTVINIEPIHADGLMYQYESDTSGATLWFDVHGKQDENDVFPGVFWGVPQISIPSRPLPVDTPILVRDSDDDVWFKRHFRAHEKGGEVTAWDSGLTSFTVGNPHRGFRYWKQWKLPDEES